VQAGDLAVSCLQDDLPTKNAAVNAAVCRASNDSAGNCLRGTTTRDQRQNVRKKATLTSCGHAGDSLSTGHERRKRLVMSLLMTAGNCLTPAAIWMDQMRSRLIRSSLATRSGEHTIPSHRRCCRWEHRRYTSYVSVHRPAHPVRESHEPVALKIKIVDWFEEMLPV
jgi:hypothetical protein